MILSSVVKGNAYGHGIEKFVPMAANAGINHFSVYSAEEAERVLNSCNRDISIMIMGMIDDEELEWAINYGIEFFVFEPGRLQKASEVAKNLAKPAFIHLEVETGLNRTGFTIEELSSVAEIFKGNEYLKLKGLCMHMAGAESIANYVRIQQQKENYRKALEWLRKHELEPQLRHTNCSAAIIRYPEMNQNLVRVGIMLYGLWPSTETFIDFTLNRKTREDPLRRLITWKSKVMSVKNVATGRYVGYGTSYLAQKDMTIAVIPVGYAHGYDRGLSNHGRVIINGKRASVVGLINMNALMIDVTGVPRVKKGDEVILIGSSNGLSISIASFSEMTNQLNYEMLSRLPGDIPRVVAD